MTQNCVIYGSKGSSNEDPHFSIKLDFLTCNRYTTRNLVSCDVQGIVGLCIVGLFDLKI
jgi:hypothetical protein